MAMRRYLLVLDMDLLTLDEDLGQEPVDYLLARQEQELEQAEVVVLSLAGTGKSRNPRTVRACYFNPLVQGSTPWRPT
jgi:hypothetical protein